MTKEKLTPNQNMAMKDMSLEQKVEYLASLRDHKSITPHLYNQLVNNFINKEMRKDLPIGQRNGFYKTQTTVDLQMKQMIELLRSKIKDFIAFRNDEAAKLSMDNVALYKRLLNIYWVKPLIDELLILGLRYPDKRLTEIASRYIQEYRISLASADEEFWLLLWSDPHFVPLDAVRIMMDTEEHRIYPCFKGIIHKLEPYIKFQRDKEQTRLNLVKYEDSSIVRAKEERRSDRLMKFEELLDAIRN